MTKPIPKFKSEEAERKFWITHDTTDYVDWSKAKIAEFPNLKKLKDMDNLSPSFKILNKWS